MTVNDFIIELGLLNPHDIVKCDMDEFKAYTYLELPAELEKKVATIPKSKLDIIYRIHNAYLEIVQDSDAMIDIQKELAVYLTSVKPKYSKMVLMPIL